MTFPMPWVDFFSLLGQFLVAALGGSIALDMFLTVVVNKAMVYRGDKKV